MGKQNLEVQGNRWIVKWIVAVVLAVATVGAPLVSSDAFGPLGDLLVQKAYACPHQGGGSC